ncbi:MAG: thioesterase family protein [Gammaproteobacteria bacterium]|nr:thioesterase family protein [Gammaproteobacteria bacterium]
MDPMSDTAFLRTHTDVVRPEWIDYNGHMNVAYYVVVFDAATDAFLEHIGMDADFRATRGGSTFAVEMHVSYLRELKLDDPVSVLTRLLDHDSKRIHYFHAMHHARDGYLAATCELMSLYVDTTRRRAAPMPESIRAALARLLHTHATHAWPRQAGHRIGIPGRRPG